MAWLLGLPLLPLIVCGVMCLVPAGLVLLGLRRSDTRATADETQRSADSRVVGKG